MSNESIKSTELSDCSDSQEQLENAGSRKGTQTSSDFVNLCNSEMDACEKIYQSELEILEFHNIITEHASEIEQVMS